MNQTTSTPTDTTATARIEALNRKLRHCRPYAAFVAICAAHGHRWACDADVERFEAAAAGIVSRRAIRAEKLDASSTTSTRSSWMFCAKALLDGRLQFVNEFPHVEGEEAEYFDGDELEPADYDAAWPADAWERETNPDYHPDVHGYHSQLDSMREGRS